MLKRLISMLIGIAILTLVMVFNNILVFAIAVTIVAAIGLYEFYSAIRQTGIRPIEWVGYLSTFLLVAIPYVSMNSLRLMLTMYLPVVILILFSISILRNVKNNVTDISVTIFWNYVCSIDASLYNIYKANGKWSLL